MFTYTGPRDVAIRNIIVFVVAAVSTTKPIAQDKFYFEKHVVT
jgi:hypothetical protein